MGGASFHPQMCLPWVNGSSQQLWLLLALVFPAVMLRVWKLDHKEGWARKNWCFWTMVLEKTLESPLDCRESQPVNPKGNQSWIFIGRTNAEAETPILCLPNELTHLKRPWCWERLKAGGEDGGWGGWVASPTRWTWIWVGSGSWWWTEKPGMVHGVAELGMTEWLNWLKWRCPGFGPLPTTWSFNSAMELSWHLWVCHFTCLLRIKV